MGSARADDGEQPLEVHGFVSQGLIKTTRNNYLANSERGSLEFTEVGINFTKQLGDQLRAGMQIFMRDLGPVGNYEPKFDWFYLDYRFFDWFGIRAGRNKLPFGLYNDTSDVDAARVPVLLPQSVYPTLNRDYLLAQTGLEIYGVVPLGGAGDLDYRAYGGTIFLDPRIDPAIRNLEIPYIFGGRLMWQTPLAGLQVGGSAQKLRLDFDFYPAPEALVFLGFDPATFKYPVVIKYPILLWVASVEYALDELLVAAEYSQWSVDLETSHPEIFPITELVNERAYVMVSYRMAPWFTPGLYYSVYFNDIEDRKGTAPGGQKLGHGAYQHDIATSFRYDLNEHWLLKLEGHYMRGTAGLDPALNDGVPVSQLPKHWGLFLVKTTAYF